MASLPFLPIVHHSPRDHAEGFPQSHRTHPAQGKMKVNLDWQVS